MRKRQIRRNYTRPRRCSSPKADSLQVRDAAGVVCSLNDSWIPRAPFLGSMSMERSMKAEGRSTPETK